MTEGWFILLWLVILLTITVLCFIVEHYHFRLDRGVFHSVVVGYIVDHYCLRFGRGVVHIVVAILLLTITV
jgi:hypothetical protein